MKISFVGIFLISLALVYIPATKHLLSFANFSAGLLIITLIMTIIYFAIGYDQSLVLRTNLALHIENYN